MVKVSAAFWIFPVVLLLVAVLPLPYAYYIFMRVVVCGAALYIAFSENEVSKGVNFWVCALLGVAVLYNPVVPFHLSRKVWLILNIATALFFASHWFAFFKRLNRP